MQWELSLLQVKSFLSSMAFSYRKARPYNSAGAPHALKALRATETDPGYRSFQQCDPLLWLATPPTSHLSEPSHPKLFVFFSPTCPAVWLFFLFFGLMSEIGHSLIIRLLSSIQHPLSFSLSLSLTLSTDPIDPAFTQLWACLYCMGCAIV